MPLINYVANGKVSKQQNLKGFNKIGHKLLQEFLNPFNKWFLKLIYFQGNMKLEVNWYRISAEFTLGAHEARAPCGKYNKSCPVIECNIKIRFPDKKTRKKKQKSFLTPIIGMINTLDYHYHGRNEFLSLNILLESKFCLFTASSPNLRP